MKQLVSIVVALVYLLLSTGFQVSAHYCHGDLESIRVLIESNSCCCGDSEMSDNCCKNENLSFEADIDNHIGVENKFKQIAYEILSNYLDFYNELVTDNEESQASIPFNPPPLAIKLPARILYCSLTFYG